MIARFHSIVAESALKHRLCAGAGAVVAAVDGDEVETALLGVGVGPETSMEAGSLTKACTGLLTAHSLLAGELTLDTRLDRLLFDEDWAGGPITVSHLATHTSGLPRLSISWLSVAAHPADPYRNCSRADLLKWLRAKRPVLPLEPSHSYSNFGYAVLGLMLEKAAGKTYQELLSGRLLDPLGMRRSGLHLTGQPDRAARGFDAKGSPTSVWHFDGYAPCGGMVSTASDLTRMMQALMQPAVQPVAQTAAQPANWMRNLIELATRPLATTQHGDIGLAWILPRGATWAWHNGATFGYSAYLAIDRSRRSGVLVLCNQCLAAEVTELGHRLMRLSENGSK